MLNKIIETRLVMAGFDQQSLGDMKEKEVLEYLGALIEISIHEAEQMEKQARR